jgi:glycosyltransferase involved in cell wall biosynthesis
MVYDVNSPFPLVTVVVPCYRGGPFLREAVKSVQEQSIDNWELIVVSDGSNDDFSDIEGSDSRIRIFRQPNRGVSIARNVGVRLARAELIALLDEDDRMLPELLSKQLAAFADDDVALCHTQFEFIDETGRVTEVGHSKDAQYQDLLGGDGRIRLSSSMLRRSVFIDVGGFNPLLPVSEDLDLFYRVARFYRVAFIPEVLAQYRIHRSNMQYHSRSGGRELRHILRAHLFLATKQNEIETIRAIRRGLSIIPSDRGSRAIGRVMEARSHQRRLELIRAFVGALIVTPRVTVRLTLREWRTRNELRRGRKDGNPEDSGRLQTNPPPKSEEPI